MGVPIIAVVPSASEHSRASGATHIEPDHVVSTNHPLKRFGNPGISPPIPYGAFANANGKRNAGSHENFYFNIRGIQSIRERFMGGAPAKLFYRKSIAQPMGIGPGHDSNPVGNVDKPEVMTIGDLATYSGKVSERIRTHLR